MKRRAFGAALALLAGTPLPALLGGAPLHAHAALPAGLMLPEPGRAGADALFAAPLIALDGGHTQLPRPQGRPLIVNFWARWCGPCKVEIPELVALGRRRSDVQVIGIALENDAAAVRDFARAYEMDYTVLLAREGGIDLMRALGNAKAGLPFTIAIHRNGELAAMRLGLMTREQLDAAAQLLLQRA